MWQNTIESNKKNDEVTHSFNCREAVFFSHRYEFDFGKPMKNREKRIDYLILIQFNWTKAAFSLNETLLHKATFQIWSKLFCGAQARQKKGWTLVSHLPREVNTIFSTLFFRYSWRKRHVHNGYKYLPRKLGFDAAPSEGNNTQCYLIMT